MKKILLMTSAAFTLGSCDVPTPSHQDVFFMSMFQVCSHEFEGKVVEGNDSDDTWRQSKIVMRGTECSPNTLKISLTVGEDSSRTWILTKGEGTITLKHDHRHEDGTPDEVTMYGGTTTNPGTSGRQEFPADQYSKDLFLEQGLDVSVENTWVMILEPRETFSYRLERPGRTFQIDFDLTMPIQ